VTNYIKHDMNRIIFILTIRYITKIFIIHLFENYPYYIVFSITLIVKINPSKLFLKIKRTLVSLYYIKIVIKIF